MPLMMKTIIINSEDYHLKHQIQFPLGTKEKSLGDISYRLGIYSFLLFNRF